MTMFFLCYQVSSNICRQLANEIWRSYAYDLDQVPEVEGIYAIGDEDGTVLYVGHSRQMRTRLHQHKSGQEGIDKFVKRKFARNGGINLRIKWVEGGYGECVEGENLEYIASILGYWPQYNIRRGNTCQ